jgi:hypothetical protein
MFCDSKTTYDDNVATVTVRNHRKILLWMNGCPYVNGLKLDRVSNRTIGGIKKKYYC